MLVLIAVLLLAIGLMLEFTLSTMLGVLALIAGILVVLELLSSSGVVNLRRD